MKKIITAFIVIILLAVFAFCFYQLFSKQKEYKDAENYYKTLVDKENGVPSNKDDSTNDTNSVEENGAWGPDFNSLANENAEIKAWINFPNTVIDYPVVQGKDNAFYLNHIFNGKKSIVGTIFINYENTMIFQKDRNTVIYGHNMNDGSMFAYLKKYQNSYQLAINPTFDIYLQDGTKKEYKIWNVAIVKGTDNIYQSAFESSEKVEEYVLASKEKGLYEIDINPNSLNTTDLVTLSTCTNRNQTERIVVQGMYVK